MCNVLLAAGMQALRSILNTFSVTNRKNMFAIKDSKESVFYIRSASQLVITHN